MKILHFVDQFEFRLGGIVQSVFQLSRALARRGVNVELATFHSSDIPASWRGQTTDSVPAVFEFSRPLKRQGRLCQQNLNEFRDRAKLADVVHLHGVWIIGNIQLAKMVQRLGTPVVISTHGMLDNWSLNHKYFRKKIYMELFGKKYIRRAAVVHCTAIAESGQVVGNLGFSPPITVIPPVVDLPAQESGNEAKDLKDCFPAIETDLAKVLFLSRVMPNKGPETLLKAMSLVRDSGHRFQLLMAGPCEPTYLAHLRRLARSLNLESQVYWLGMQKEPAKSALYRESDLFVLPTVQENFGIVLAEAMSMGLPLITTQGTDIWQELAAFGATIVEHGVPPLAEAIIAKLESLHEVKQAARLNALQIRSWLDVDQISARYCQMYQQAME